MRPIIKTEHLSNGMIRHTFDNGATATFERFGWPNGAPIKTERLPSGITCYTLEGGRLIGVRDPHFSLEYRSSVYFDETGWETYEVEIDVIGLSMVNGFFEAWNFEVGEMRNYRFDKSVSLTDLSSGEIFGQNEIEAALKSGPRYLNELQEIEINCFNK